MPLDVVWPKRVERMVNGRELAGVAHFVEVEDDGFALLQQAPYDGSTDETSTPCDQNPAS